LCELYAVTRSDVSDYSYNESLDSDSGVPTTSSRKQLRYSTGPLIPHFPHPFFLTYIKTIFITVRLAQTLLDRHGRVNGTMRANSGIPCDCEGEGKRSKNEKSAFRRNGDVMVQVWKDKTCAYDKYNP
jgi:hypothetical protein